MTRARRHFVKPLALGLAAMALAGCASTFADSTGRYATPIGRAPVISNETPYSRGLACIAGYNSGRLAPRIAVGQIADYTGKWEADATPDPLHLDPQESLCKIFEMCAASAARTAH